ncbi:hypothetical protein [Cytobacillus firmus]|uniref:hypothetical protein n=1 Tax=Cytobacillus firmus TaxID=1399 RepID=UPI0018CE72B0|nr:hypothetical protein [Cytobacillus firmus]MBG9445569.1 hypothetical protein [Cytobacillus firmus]
MILTKIVKVRWHRKTKEHYVKILNTNGIQKYKFTRFGDSFLADFNDIHPNCTLEINLRCDYCLEVEKKIYRNWKTHFDKSPIKKEACLKCRGRKIAESNLATFGTANVMQLEKVKFKLKQTNIKRYGVPNAASTKEIKDM